MQQFDSFAQMQRDAERRVMEMQKRARAAIDYSDPPPVIIEAPDRASPVPRNEPPSPPAEPLAEPPAAPAVTQGDEDAEWALIMMILLLLIREQADERLLFALLYMLL